MKQVTLVYLRKNGRILLAMKKRGFGTGKWNGAGGKVEPGETVMQAAMRECEEEIGIIPLTITVVGRLQFFMPEDDPEFAHDCTVFVCSDWKGEPQESDEMRPQWFEETALPYETMWPDDVAWMPLLLAGERFAGAVHTSQDKLLRHTVKAVDFL